VIQLLRELSDLVRWRWALSFAVVVLGLLPSSIADAAMQDTNDRSRTDVANPSLPPRALLRIGTDDLRVDNHITAFAFSPDGRLIAATDAVSRRAIIFDVRSGRAVKQLAAPGNHEGWMISVAFSPDGATLLWGETGGEVALWDLGGDRLLFREKMHEGRVNDVGFSPDGRLIASAGGDVIHLRRVAKPAEVVRDLTARPVPALGGLGTAKAAVPGIGGPVDITCLAFTCDGTRLVAGTSGDAAIFIWRIRDGRLERTIPSAHGNPAEESHNPRLNCVAVTPDGRRIMSVGRTMKPVEHTKLKYGFPIAPMSEVRFWDVANGECVADYHGDEDYGEGYGALSRDGRRVAVADFSCLRILDAATGQTERMIDLPGSWGARPAFSPDGTHVAVPDHNTIGIFELSTGRRLHHDASTPVRHSASAAWSPSGERIVTGHADGFVRVWDASTGKLILHKLLAPLESRSGWLAHPGFVTFSGDGKLVIAAGSRDDPVTDDGGIVAIYEASGGGTVREVLQKEIRWAELARDGRMIVAATSRGSRGDTHFIGIEVATGRTRWTNPSMDQRAGFYPLAGLQFEANSPWFEAALIDGKVIRFNALTGHEQRRFLAEWRTPEQQEARKPREPDMWEAAFSADGRTLVSAGMECIYVWDVQSGTLRRKIRYPHKWRGRLALAPDGRMLATSDVRYVGERSEDTIHLQDFETGEPVLTLEPGGGRASVMVFSPDGTKLFTGFGRSSGIVWDVRRGSAEARAKE
jgi:WD40 repeat protein